MKALLPGDPGRIGAYVLLGRLGEGGMGVVYLGRSPGGRTVALKTVHRNLVDAPGFRKRFDREVRACRAVSGPGVVPVVDADPAAAVPWLATTYVPGPSLGEAVTEYGPLDENALWRLLHGLVEALGAVHAAGLVHRDLKPSNVLLALDGPRLIDFGIARATDETALTGTGAVVGSPGYMSPEQARGKTVDVTSDVFSLGAVLAYAATGRGPFGAGSSHELLYRIVYEDHDLTGVPPEPAELIGHMLAKDPAHRPELRELAERAASAVPADGGGRREWLPAEVLGDIARRAEELLHLDRGPATQVAAPDRPVRVESMRTETMPAGARPAELPPAGPPSPGPGPARPSGTSRRRLLLGGLGAGALALGGVWALKGAPWAGRGRRLRSPAWQFEADSPVSAAPVAVNPQLVAFGDNQGNVVAVDDAGPEQKWSTDIGGSVHKLWTVEQESGSRLVAMNGDGVIHLLDPAGGEVLWERKFHPGDAVLPVKEGLLVVRGADVGLIRAVEVLNVSDGGTRMQKSMNGIVPSDSFPDLVDVDGSTVRVYFLDGRTRRSFFVDDGDPWGEPLELPGNQRSLWSSGNGESRYFHTEAGVAAVVYGSDDAPYSPKAKWSFRADAGTGGRRPDTGGPLLTDDAVVFRHGRSVYAVEQVSGRRRWKYVADQSIGTVPQSTGEDGRTVYFVADHALHALDTRTAKIWWTFSPPDDEFRSLSVGRTALYAATTRSVYRLGPTGPEWEEDA